MDFLKKAMSNPSVSNALGGGSSSSSSSSQTQPQAGQPAQPKKEDHLDQAIDMFQERVLKQGSQKNESAAEQAKDDQIKKGITSMYKMATGKNFPGTK